MITNVLQIIQYCWFRARSYRPDSNGCVRVRGSADKRLDVNAPMKVNISPPKGKPFGLIVDHDDTTGDLKHKVEDKKTIAIAPKKTKICFHGKRLKNRNHWKIMYSK